MTGSLPAEAFFQAKTRDCIALTFADVRLDTGYADFYPEEIFLEGRFSRNVSLPVPIAGAAMSSVVGIDMAIALAKFGGIASIPRSLDPEAQSKLAARVKNNIHGFTDNPIPAYEGETVAELLKRREEHQWKFDSFPVLDKDGSLAGLMTHQNFKRSDDHSLPVGAVMTKRRDLITADKGVSKQDAYQKLKDSDKNILPVLNPDGSLAGIYVFSDLKRMLVEKATHNVDAQGRLRVCAAIGVGEEAMQRAELLAEKGVDVLHIDMAHGWQKIVVDTIRMLKQKYPDGPDIIAGNISNRNAAVALAEAGADGILVGQGGGAICTTRPVTGIGKPQVSAVYECARAIWPSRVPIISDGGIVYSGDIVVALAAGAKSVMVGNLLAGTEETPGKVKPRGDGTFSKDFYGMGSIRAMEESSGSRKRYLQSEGPLVPEGIEGEVSYKGAVADVLAQQAGGIRKGMHYCGARTIDQLRDKAKFFQVSAAGIAEGHPHNVTMSVRPPNYSGR